MLTANRARELLHYNPDTGVLTWKVRRTSGRNGARVVCLPGQIAGGKGKAGYLQLSIDGKKQQAHRVAWLIAYGSFPARFIDHINCDKADNRLANLREADESINSQNQRNPMKKNGSGLLGVSWSKAAGRWVAQITVGPKKHHLGTFLDKMEAHAAYVEAKRQLHAGCTL